MNYHGWIGPKKRKVAARRKTAPAVMTAHFAGAHDGAPQPVKCSPCRFHEGILDGSIMAKDRATAYQWPSTFRPAASCCFGLSSDALLRHWRDTDGTVGSPRGLATHYADTLAGR